MTRHVQTPQGICRFGIAHGDITPPAGIYCRMWGAARHDRAGGVHRPLRATALAFAPAEADGAAPQLLIALDHCLLGGEEMSRLMQAVAELSGVSEESIAVVFSHTHAAGWMSLDRAHLPGGDLIPPYFKKLADRTAELAATAVRGIEEATITYGQGRCDLASHRDFFDEQADEIVCGYNPLAAADDTLLVARATAADGRLLATLVNYACHPTTLAWQNSLISPDFPGAMREIVEQATAAPCVFLQGASGELGPREGFVGDVETADRNGRRLGYAALAALEALPPPGTRFQYMGRVVSGATLGTWAHQPLSPGERREKSRFEIRRAAIDLPYRDDLPAIDTVRNRKARWEADEAAARSAGDEARAADCRAHVERCTRRLSRLAALPAGEHFPYGAVLWRVGDGWWLAVEGEPYSDLQTRLRERFSGVPIFVCSLASGSRPSYLPPRELYGRGIYQEKVAVLAPGSLEALIAAVAGLIDDMNE